MMRWGCKRLSLLGVIVSLSILNQGIASQSYANRVSFPYSNSESIFYIGLDYSPSFSRVKNFSMGTYGEETKGIFPYSKTGTRVELKSQNFDWNAPNPEIKFKNNMLMAPGISVGYSMGGVRFEVEVGYERFNIQGSSVRKRGENADEMFLLAKGLATYSIRGDTVGLASAISKTYRRDMRAFATAISTAAPALDKKICRHMPAWYDGKKNWTSSHALPRNIEGACSCLESPRTDDSSACGLGRIVIFNEEAWRAKPNAGKLSLAFGQAAEKDREAVDSSTAWAMAKDIAALTPEEKTTVANIFARAVEGAEVVEMKAITSTSVMVNLCYDFVGYNIGIAPYACVGFGNSLIDVAGGHITPKFSCRGKAGISYFVSPEITIFLGGYYHKVLGDGKYDDLPARRMNDDTSRFGRTRDTFSASFGLSYYGGEFGVRFMF